MSRRGFTFIEVLAVVVLLGLLAGATAWSLAESARRSSLENIVGRIAHVDRTTRIAAERFGEPRTLRFDLDRGRLQRVARGDDGEKHGSHATRIPAPFRIGEIVLPRPGGRAERFDVGVVELVCSPGGRSKTYAIRVDAPEESVWLVFSGLTGQMILIEHESDVDDIFALLEAGRPDAD